MQDDLQSQLADFARRRNVARLDPMLRDALQGCIDAGLDQLPMPGSGRTLNRWRQLATVAGVDLALFKLYEGHTDALAIMQELGAPQPPASFAPSASWGVWAAEPPNARVEASKAPSEGHGNRVQLNGTKAWCSGAQQIDCALITAWDHDTPWLVAFQLDQPGVTIDAQAWQAVGMASTASVDVHLDNAIGYCIGASGAYLARPGFWHGGAGIAAAWYGAAVALARALHDQRTKGRNDPHADAHLGAVDAALYGASVALRDCAAWIDAHPQADASLPVQRLRAQVESAVDQVCRHVARALGAAPFCRDAHFARLATDLPVFIRQSHAERDLAGLGQLVAAHTTEHWSL